MYSVFFDGLKLGERTSASAARALGEEYARLNDMAVSALPHWEGDRGYGALLDVTGGYTNIWVSTNDVRDL